jgi:hypothetical protein
VFARAFKADVQPVEIAAALQRELDGSARIVSRDRRLVPNDFVIDLSPHDHDKLAPFTAALVRELSGSTREYADMQGYVFPGPLHIGLDRDEKLSTGRFAIRSAVVADTSDRESAGAWESGAPPSAQPGYDERYAGPVGPAAVSMVPGFGSTSRAGAHQIAPEPESRGAGAGWSAGSWDDADPDAPAATAVGSWSGIDDEWSDGRDDPPPFAHLQVLGGDRIGVEPPGVVIGRSSTADGCPPRHCATAPGSPWAGRRCSSNSTRPGSPPVERTRGAGRLRSRTGTASEADRRTHTGATGADSVTAQTPVGPER